METKNDMVNEPPHYKSKSGVQCIDFTEHMGFCVGNAFKYVWRAGEKIGSNKLEDLKKALWYVERAFSNTSLEPLPIVRDRMELLDKAGALAGALKSMEQTTDPDDLTPKTEALGYLYACAVAAHEYELRSHLRDAGLVLYDWEGRVNYAKYLSTISRDK